MTLVNQSSDPSLAVRAARYPEGLRSHCRHQRRVDSVGPTAGAEETCAATSHACFGLSSLGPGYTAWGVDDRRWQQLLVFGIEHLGICDIGRAALETRIWIGAPYRYPTFSHMSRLTGQIRSVSSFPHVTSWNSRSSKSACSPPRVRHTNSLTTSSCPSTGGPVLCRPGQTSPAPFLRAAVARAHRVQTEDFAPARRIVGRNDSGGAFGAGMLS